MKTLCCFLLCAKQQQKNTTCVGCGDYKAVIIVFVWFLSNPNGVCGIYNRHTYKNTDTEIIIQGIKCSLINYTIVHTRFICAFHREVFAFILMILFGLLLFLTSTTCMLIKLSSHTLAICTHIAKSVENPTVNLIEQQKPSICMHILIWWNVCLSKSRMLMSRNEQKLYSNRLCNMTSNLASNYIASASVGAAAAASVAFR